MKRFLASLLSFLLILTALCGCQEEQEMSMSYTALSSDPIESYDSESYFIIETESDVSDEESVTVSETPDKPSSSPENQTSKNGFLIKDKKYPYKRPCDTAYTDVVLLNVTNETNRNYEITIEMTYFAKNETQLTTETQTYQDIAAGHSTYFLFQPQISFDHYKYKVSAKEIDGACYLSNIVQMDWNSDTANFQHWLAHCYDTVQHGDTKMYNHIYTKVSFQNQNDLLLYVRAYIIVFDRYGEIAYITLQGDAEFEAGGILDRSALVYYTLADLNIDRETWPENLQGELRAIIIPFRAVTYEQKRQEMGLPLE